MLKVLAPPSPYTQFHETIGDSPVELFTNVTVLMAQSFVGCCILKFAVGEATTLTGTLNVTAEPATVPLNTAVKLPGVKTLKPPLLKLEGGYGPNVHELLLAPAGAVKVILAGAHAVTKVEPCTICAFALLNKSKYKINRTDVLHQRHPLLKYFFAIFRSFKNSKSFLL